MPPINLGKEECSHIFESADSSIAPVIWTNVSRIIWTVRVVGITGVESTYKNCVNRFHINYP